MAAARSTSASAAFGDGRRRRVRRHGRPQRRRRQAGAGARIVQRADDAGRALVARPGQAEPVDERLVGGRADQRHRSRVGDVGRAARRASAPAGVCCSAAMAVIWRQNVRHRSCGSVPRSRARRRRAWTPPTARSGARRSRGSTPSARRTIGPRRAEVVELLGIDGGDLLGAPRLDEVANAPSMPRHRRRSTR